MKKQNSLIDRFYYLLNAVYYCLWRFDIRTQNGINKQLRMVFYPIWRFLPEKFKVKYKKNMASQQNEINSYFYDKRNGFHISMANRYFVHVCYMYTMFITFIILGIILKLFNVYNILIGFVLFVPAVIINSIILKKGVFKNDRYLKYFKKFEKKDELWHKKWGRITTCFCIGGIFSAILGIFFCFMILLSGL